MILTGQQIKWAKEKGYLDISDWDDKRLNPNSYNLRLADEIAVYKPPISEKEAQELTAKYDIDPDFRRAVNNIVYEGKSIADIWPLDMKKEMELFMQSIPEDGFVLEPGRLYLGRTMEYTETHKFVPMLEGRSSVGRLGISIHSTAGFGDIGFCGYWTLEISCVQPVRIYSGVEICQIYYHTIAPDCDIWIPDDDNKSIMKYKDSGKYQNNTGIQPSMMWKEF